MNASVEPTGGVAQRQGAGRLRALETCFGPTPTGVEVADPLVDVLPAGELQLEVVQPGPPGAEFFPVGIGIGVKAHEHQGAGAGRHNRVTVAGPVLAALS